MTGNHREMKSDEPLDAKAKKRKLLKRESSGASSNDFLGMMGFAQKNQARLKAQLTLNEN